MIKIKKNGSPGNNYRMTKSQFKSRGTITFFWNFRSLNMSHFDKNSGNRILKFRNEFWKFENAGAYQSIKVCAGVLSQVHSDETRPISG